MTTTVYVEGGGKNRALSSSCREGFRKFFEAAGLEGRMPKIVPSGSRQDAFAKFRTALAQQSETRSAVLLVDSESPVGEGVSTCEHLRLNDNWQEPEQATTDSVHLMVQCMESWFLADIESLRAFFGDGFNARTLPARSEIEQIPKSEVLTSLKNATRKCGRTRKYTKGRHSFAILAASDPTLVIERSPHARRLVDFLKVNGHPTPTGRDEK